MNTSKKILLAVAGLMIIILLITVMSLRNGVQSLRAKAELKHKYTAVAADEFERLDFSSRWIVKIKQGKACRVESTAGENSPLKPTMENINGTLYFKVDTAIAKAFSDSLYVRITMPSLHMVRAVNGTEINIENFQSDSLSVILENGCAFTGINNTIKYTSFKTSGDNSLNFVKTF